MDIWVVLTYFFVIAIILVVPLVLGYIINKKLKVSWTAFIIALIFFFVVQIFHTPLVLVFGTPIYSSLSFLQNSMLELGIYSIILGGLAGLFEEIGKYLVFKHYLKKKKIKPDKESGLMLGVGWSMGEVIFVGGILAISMVSYMAIAPLTTTQIQDINTSYGGKLTGGQLVQIEAQIDKVMNITPLDIIPGIFERMMVIVLQAAFTLLVFKAIVQKRKSLLVLAILAHAFVDASAVFIGQIYGLWVSEFILLALAFVALAYIIAQFRKSKNF